MQGLRGTSERLWRLRRLQRLRSKSVERLRRVRRLRSTSLERLWRLRRLRRLRLRHLPDMDRPGLDLGLLAVASWGQSGPRRGDLAPVIPLDAHAVPVGRIADYHAGRFPSAQPHSSAERQRLRGRDGRSVAKGVILLDGPRRGGTSG